MYCFIVLEKEINITQIEHRHKTRQKQGIKEIYNVIFAISKLYGKV